MIQPEASDEVLEQAALYALGVLEGKEKEGFEKLVAEGCATCQAVKDFQNVANLLGTSATSMTPPSSLRATILERIAAERQSEPVKPTALSESSGQSGDTGFTFVRSQDEGWRAIGPGIRVKLLSFDPTQRRMTVLARMDPHSSFTPHEHTAPEEFYVLEGTCLIGGQLLQVGDYHRAETGTFHHETSTEDGCLMLTMFSPNQEMLKALA
ncbi:MAG: cupin domain-containing protein [Nitrospirales bacterium]